MPFSDNALLTTIVRFHSKTRLVFLNEALASLASQSWRNIEVLLAVQNPDKELADLVSTAVEACRFPPPGFVRILPVIVPDGIDGRSKLLNAAIHNARGRYLAFL